MNKIVTYVLAVTIATVGMATPSFATVSNNRGSVVKVSASCDEIIESVINNRGSKITITGDGTCNIQEIINSGAIRDNRGSTIKIDGVCGFVPAEITDNRGSVIKISSVGQCSKMESGSGVVNTISDNRGSIIVTETSGNMNIENNRGSVIKTKNDGNVKVDNNRGSIIEVKTGRETVKAPVAEKPKTNKPVELAKQTDKKQVPAKKTSFDALPQTGSALAVSAMGILSLGAYGIAYFVTSLLRRK